VHNENATTELRKSPEIIIGSEFAKTLIPLIDQATDEIIISVFLWNYYFSDPGALVQKFNQALIRARARGVKIKGLTAGIQKLRKMSELGIEIKESNFANKLHNKIIIIDRKYCIIGSHNLTKNALERNYEVSVCFEIEGAENRLYKFVKSMVEHGN
jgi:phosphatidylserine/phosphatidylglycerophosphate/cardiolipin synthase-like enzyme